MNYNSRLGQIAEIVMGQSPKGKDVNSSGEGIPLLNGPAEFTARNPIPLQFTKKGKKFAENGDILFCVRGSTTGRMNYADQQYVIGRGIAAIRGKNGYPTQYVRAVIERNLDRLLTAATGSTFPNVSRDLLLNFEIETISPDDAVEVSTFIVNLEDKIEFNYRINQTLEDIAQALFKSWFVDFEPVKAKIEANAIGQDPEWGAMCAISGNTAAKLDNFHPEQLSQLRATAALFPDEFTDSELGPIPKGWKAGSVGDVAAAKGGYAYKSKIFTEVGHPVVKIKNIVGDGTVNLNECQCIDDDQAQATSRFNLSDGDLLMAMTGATVGKVGLVVLSGKTGYLNQRVAKFESGEFGPGISWFLFCALQRESIFEQVVGTAQGSAQPNISSKGIESTRLVIPPTDCLREFIAKVDPLFLKWMSNQTEIKNLASIRDTLLPKLLRVRSNLGQPLALHS